MAISNEKNLNALNIFIAIILISVVSCKSKNEEKPKKVTTSFKESPKNEIKFTYQEITGIGSDNLYNRRDNSDIIKVGDTYYVWYSRMDSPVTSGYWATIWYATSKDEGYTWQEQGIALGLGEKGQFDSHSVFTPNILAYKGKYYLYYTGVKPTQENENGDFEGNHTTDITAIGLAVSDSADGPFKRIENNPILTISETPEDFDSYRIDDSSLIIRDHKVWLYYKGRSIVDGSQGPRLTKMGVAFSDYPIGPFTKHEQVILDHSHEVLIWKKNTGVASLASINKTINYASNGIDFDSLYANLKDIPKAPGLYRTELEDGNIEAETPSWGISMKVNKGQAYLVRFNMK